VYLDGDNILFNSMSLLGLTACRIQARLTATPNSVRDIRHRPVLMSDIVCFFPDAADIFPITHFCRIEFLLKTNGQERF
jgi:hypothetical protein